MAERESADAVRLQFAPLVQRLIANRATLLGGENVVVQTLEHLPRRYSDVLRLRIDDGATSRFAYLKINRLVSEQHRPRAERCLADDFAQQQRAHQAMGPQVARPIACFPESLAVVSEAAHGETLDARARRADPQLELAFERAGQWLAVFQGTSVAGPLIPIARVRAYVAERLRAALPAGKERRVLSHFDRLAARVRPEELREVPVHGDFSMENVLFDGQRITAIDFDVAGGPTGTWLHDATYLWVWLERHAAKPWVSSRPIRRAQAALLRGLDARLTPQAPLFRLLLLQHAACSLVVAREGSRGVLRDAWAHWLGRIERTWLGL